MKIAQRKEDHLVICLENEVEVGSTGLEEYRFVHNALPELDLTAIDTKVKFLGKTLEAPILISPLTGGCDQALVINRNLAQAAAKLGVALAVGSQRIAVEAIKQKKSEAARIAESFAIVRKYAPSNVVLANLGAVQLNYGFGIRECQLAVEMIKADGLIFHLNPLQEAIQPEGNTNFAGLLAKIGAIAKKLAVPVIVKEVGCGIFKEVAKRLVAAGVRIVDVAGWGGTNWALIEGKRRGELSELGKIFSQWGIPTAEAIKECAQVEGLTIIGSGGIRNGIEVAKAIAQGADLVGIGLPLLRPATHSADEVVAVLSRIIQELRIAMFCCGAKNIDQLKKQRLVRTRCII